MNYPAVGAGSLPPDFTHVSGLPTNLVFGRQIFAMAKGRSVIPHGHDNMATGFLVLKGNLRGRHWDRVEDHKDHYLIRPTIDRTFKPGEYSTISDHKDNVHWFTAESRARVHLQHPRHRHATRETPGTRDGSTSTRSARRWPADWSRPRGSPMARPTSSTVEFRDLEDQSIMMFPLYRCPSSGRSASVLSRGACAWCRFALVVIFGAVFSAAGGRPGASGSLHNRQAQGTSNPLRRHQPR